MKVLIVDYEMGNLGSVQKAFDHLDVLSIISNDHEEIKNADLVVLPGVGSFQKGIENLHRLGLFDLLTQEVVHHKKPFLGICLGMQLLATYGEEPVHTEGLNWIPGKVIKMTPPNLRVPHMGWNNIEVKQDDYYGSISTKDFYFIHSYHFVADDPGVISSTVNYGGEMVSSIQQGNIFATQFHPEKSQKAGLQVLKNFIDHHA
ncbi:MAG: hisH2 [Chitinophagaceae bacterium]|nr:hisH2 [Chitinophagaceae bacterium]